MKLYLYADDTTLYELREKSEPYAVAVVELLPEEFAEYQRASNEFAKWQERLAGHSYQAWRKSMGLA